MKTVLRQEWKASRRRIEITSIVLAVIILGSVLVNFTAFQTHSGHVTSFGTFLYICSIIIGTIGIPIYALVRGSGNIRSTLFEDTSYLTLLVPRRSYIMLGGKQIINLAEFVIYFIPAMFYLSLLGPTGGLIWKWNGVSVQQVSSYWHSVGNLYHEIFVSYPLWTLQAVAMILIAFVAVQATINCAFTIYASFIRSKRPHKLLMALIIFLLFYIEIRVSTWGMKEIMFNNRSFPQQNSIGMYWYHIGIFAAFGAAYFILTGWLMEHRIEV